MKIIDCLDTNHQIDFVHRLNYELGMYLLPHLIFSRFHDLPFYCFLCIKKVVRVCYCCSNAYPFSIRCSK